MTKQKNSSDLIICGGGIAGLTLSVLLGQTGLAVDLIEPKPPDTKSIKASGRTVALMQASLNVIKACGVWDELESKAGKLEQMQIVDISKTPPLEAPFPALDIGMEAFGYNVPNAELRAALFTKAKSTGTIRIHETGLADYTPDEFGVSAMLANGEELRSPLIIGVDGRNSRIRETAGIRTRNYDYRQTAITCLIEHSAPHNNISTEFHRPAGPLALVPLPGHVSSVVWVEPTQRADDIMRADKDTFLLTMRDIIGDRLGELALKVPPESWPLRSLVARRLTAPRMALAAEAAHVISPITAQGLNLSLRDIAALAETIVDARRNGQDIGLRTVLGKYEQRRMLDMTTRVFGVNSLNMFVSAEQTLIKDARRNGLKMLDAFPMLKSAAMRAGLAPPIDQGRLAKGEPL